MRDIELYQAILGFQDPWTVVNVELDRPGQQVVVTVDPGPGPFSCQASSLCLGMIASFGGGDSRYLSIHDHH